MNEPIIPIMAPIMVINRKYWRTYIEGLCVSVAMSTYPYITIAPNRIRPNTRQSLAPNRAASEDEENMGITTTNPSYLCDL